METPQLWNWEVAEAFIGWDFQHIARCKEFEVSPQSEWVDLDINREDPKAQQGMKWNSRFAVKARIDAQAKIWHGEMRIPFQGIDGRRLRAGSCDSGCTGSLESHPRLTSLGARRARRRVTCRRPSGHCGCVD